MTNQNEITNAAYDLDDIQMIAGLCKYALNKPDLSDEQQIIVADLLKKSLKLKELVLAELQQMKDEQDKLEQERIDASDAPEDMTANKAEKQTKSTRSKKTNK